MASDPVIRVEDVHKRYRLGVIGSSLVTEEASALWARMRGRPDPRYPIPAEADAQRRGQWFWALQGVSFEVHRGGILGIVGRNGAGKSTILKLLSRISLPTKGRILRNGRLSSLLEVGTGFHPELTGMENIFLNGAILGMRRAEIAARLDEIIAFSGIEHHIHTPIKRYSSGMKVRLGFAVAAHLDPDILIVDEVLAVGDAEFQRKCLGSMRNVAGSGRTILLVSHNVNAVHGLCDRALWMDRGLVHMEGGTHEVVRAYLEKYAALATERTWDPAQAPGSETFRLLAARAVSECPQGSYRTDMPIRLEFEFLHQDDTDGAIGIQLRVSTHNDVLAFVSVMSRDAEGGDEEDTLWVRGRNKVACIIPAHLLNEGGYRFALAAVRRGRSLWQEADVLALEVHRPTAAADAYERVPGVVHPVLRWER